MTDSKRNYYSAEEKTLAIKRHLIDKEQVSDICDDLGIHPNVFYEWQNKLFTEGGLVFSKPRETKKLREQLEKLEAKSSRKDTVIAELMEEMLDLKKNLGEF